MASEGERMPTEHGDGPALYGRMMKAIAAGHTFGNNVRMVKLPLIFAEQRLYAGAIAQFFWLTETLEAALRRHVDHPMVARLVKALGLSLTPGYAADLEELYGADWRSQAERERTAATSAYCAVLDAAGPVELVAATFILYGALVVGGGKATQAKVRKVIPHCRHALFDVAEDMKACRQTFKSTFTAIGREWPEHFDELVAGAARFMGLNNTVILSIRCWGWRATTVTLAVATGVAAMAVAVRLRRHQ